MSLSNFIIISQNFDVGAQEFQLKLAYVLVLKEKPEFVNYVHVMQ